MRRSMKFLITTIILVAMSITSVVFADSYIVKDMERTVNDKLLVLKIVDDKIVAKDVDNIYVSIGDAQKNNNNFVYGIAKLENKVINADGIKYTVNDGHIIMEIQSTSQMARLMGKNGEDIKVRITLANGEVFDVLGNIAGIFSGSVDVPLDDSANNGNFLFVDYRFTANGHPEEKDGADQYYSAVEYMKGIGVVNGTTEGYLFPDSNITLKEFMAMLSRLMQYYGKAKNYAIENVYGANMVDNPYDSWFKNDYAVLMNLWGTQAGETTERGKTTLLKVLDVEAGENLNSTVTREEALIMIGALFGEPEIKLSLGAYSNYDPSNVLSYKDGEELKEKELHAHMKTVGIWFDKNNIDLRNRYQGENVIEPNKELTRVQTIGLLYRGLANHLGGMQLKPDPFVKETGNAMYTEITMSDSYMAGLPFFIHAKNSVDRIVAIRYHFESGFIKEHANSWEINKAFDEKDNVNMDPDKEFYLERRVDLGLSGPDTLSVCVITADGSSKWFEKKIDIIQTQPSAVFTEDGYVMGNEIFCYGDEWAYDHDPFYWYRLMQTKDFPEFN